MANDTPSPLEETITDLAQLPQSTTADGTTTTERSGQDLIEIDKHLGGNQSLRRKGFGILRQKISRGDALGGHS